METVNLRIVKLAYWLIRLRWYAIIGIIIAFLIAKYILNISIWEFPIYLIILIFITLNTISFLGLKYLQSSGIKKYLNTVKLVLNFQISTDLVILTLLLHFSGGVENPFIIYYVFHMIISSIVLTPRESFFQTSFALILIGTLAFFEYSGIIPHYPLVGFIVTNMYNNLTYLISTGVIFISTSYFIIFITGNIVKESKNHEAAYLKANFELKQKDKIKDEYVMRVTHDIKGHITAIQSIVSVLSKKLAGPLNPVQEEYVNRATERIKTLNKFILDLLNITKKKLQLKSEKKYFNLAESFEEVFKMVKNSAQEKNISIIKNIKGSISDIYGEKTSIEEVLLNLFSNAVKYSLPDKTVIVNAFDKKDKILIEVIDTGVGIPEEEIPMMFTEFFRASNVKTQIKSGTGLGLAISKQIVENHGGKIWVESKLNEGTKFSVLLKKHR